LKDRACVLLNNRDNYTPVPSVLCFLHQLDLDFAYRPEKMKLETVVLSLAAARLSAAFFPSPAFKRDEDTCKLSLASSSGGRKVALVIDASGSMMTNDPQDLRIMAGRALNRQLISAAEASDGKGADQVAVVE
jgi:Mg-chelatase subunit ChlD